MQMKPILIHIHVFYEELLPEIEKCLESFAAYPHEIWVTYVEENENVRDALKHYERVIPVPNRGYDVGPFIHILRQVSLDKYSYIAKLHTKRDLPEQDIYMKNVRIGGSRWRA